MSELKISGDYTAMISQSTEEHRERSSLINTQHKTRSWHLRSKGKWTEERNQNLPEGERVPTWITHALTSEIWQKSFWKIKSCLPLTAMHILYIYHGKELGIAKSLQCHDINKKANINSELDFTFKCINKSSIPTESVEQETVPVWVQVLSGYRLLLLCHKRTSQQTEREREALSSSHDGWSTTSRDVSEGWKSRSAVWEMREEKCMKACRLMMMWM